MQSGGSCEPDKKVFLCVKTPFGKVHFSLSLSHTHKYTDADTDTDTDTDIHTHTHIAYIIY